MIPSTSELNDDDRADVSPGHPDIVSPSALTPSETDGSGTADRVSCRTLKRFFIRQHRSLLQYADLCWPWADQNDSDERILLRNLAARQRAGLRGLVRLLDERGWAVEYGRFPETYTDLNFVAIQHLCRKIVEHEQHLLVELKETRQKLQNDPQSLEIIDECLLAQREILNALQTHIFADGRSTKQRDSSTQEDRS